MARRPSGRYLHTIMDEITVSHAMPDRCQGKGCMICYPRDWGEVPGGGVKAYYKCPECWKSWTCYWGASYVFPDRYRTTSIRSERIVTSSPSSGQGFVYVARCGKYCKIGYSVTPEQRISALQIGNPELVTLLGTIEGSQVLEDRLHAKFRGKHVRGEWFELSDEDVRSILQGNHG